MSLLHPVDTSCGDWGETYEFRAFTRLKQKDQAGGREAVLEGPLRFVPTPLTGAFVIEIERRKDERGYLTRTWCREEFAAHGIAIEFVQASVSHNAKAGTVRGMHLQLPPSREAKLVRCERGRIHDVIIDLRPDAPTFMKHFAVTLDAERRNALYIPPGMGHGFQTLSANTDVSYMMSDYYKPELQAGVRWNDAAFGIAWPLPVASIIARDREYPDFDAATHAARYRSAMRLPRAFRGLARGLT